MNNIAWLGFAYPKLPLKSSAISQINPNDLHTVEREMNSLHHPLKIFLVQFE